MPGERVEDALEAARLQRPRGITAILTNLGENLTNPRQADDVTRHYLDVLDRIAASGLDAHISVKPTQLGLDFDEDNCFQNLSRLLERARPRQQFIWIDMESSAYVDRTLALFRRAVDRSPLVGVALQAYLRRTPADLDRAARLRAGDPARERRLSGAGVDRPDAEERNRRELLQPRGAAADRGGEGQSAGSHRHARRAPRESSRCVRRRPADCPGAYEYAMLYGIQRPMQERLSAEGKRMRVLIAYGDNWFPWYMRRLAERPANLWFIVRN